MQRCFVALLVGALSVVGLAGPAESVDVTLFAELCWQKAPYSDIVKLSIFQGQSLFALHGVQFTDSYSLPFSGTAFIIGDQAILAGMFIGDGIHFGGTAGLTESVTLSLFSANGPGTMVSVDGKYPSVPSTWTLVPCPAGPSVHSSAPG